MKYGDNVKVTVGFYEGFTGTLCEKVNKGLYKLYTRLPHILDYGYIIVNEEDLQLIDTINN